MNRRSLLRLILALPGMLPAVALAKPYTNKTLPLLATQLAGFQYHLGEQVWDRLHDNDELTLRREPENRHDPRAVAIYWRDYKLGYVPHLDNAVIAQLMDRRTPLRAQINQLRASANPWQRVGFTINLAV